MANVQHVIFTFVTPRERMQTAFFADGADAIAAAGQNLVWISLMAHIPDQMIKRRVIDVMQRNGQFHHAEAGSKVPAGLAYAIQQVLPQLATQGWQLLFRQ